MGQGTLGRYGSLYQERSVAASLTAATSTGGIRGGRGVLVGGASVAGGRGKQLGRESSALKRVPESTRAQAVLHGVSARREGQLQGIIYRLSAVRSAVQ